MSGKQIRPWLGSFLARLGLAGKKNPTVRLFRKGLSEFYIWNYQMGSFISELKSWAGVPIMDQSKGFPRRWRKIINKGKI